MSLGVCFRDLKALFSSVAYGKRASHLTSLVLIRARSHSSRVGQLAWRPWSCGVYDLALGSVWWHLRVAACQPPRLGWGLASQGAGLLVWAQQAAQNLGCEKALPCGATGYEPWFILESKNTAAA